MYSPSGYFIIFDPYELSIKTSLGILTRMTFNPTLDTTQNTSMLYRLDLSDISRKIRKAKSSQGLKSAWQHRMPESAKKGDFLPGITAYQRPIYLWKRFQFYIELCIFNNIRVYLCMAEDLQKMHT